MSEHVPTLCYQLAWQSSDTHDARYLVFFLKKHLGHSESDDEHA
jgi:hypothetical protein